MSSEEFSDDSAPQVQTQRPDPTSFSLDSSAESNHDEEGYSGRPDISLSPTADKLMASTSTSTTTQARAFEYSFDDSDSEERAEAEAEPARAAHGTAPGAPSSTVLLPGDERQQQRAIASQIRKLQVQASALERDIFSCVRERHLDGADSAALLAAMDTAAAGHLRESQELATQLKRVRALVLIFGQALTAATTTPEGVDRLRVAMEEAEGAIVRLKHSQRDLFAGLQREEAILDRELAANIRLISAWDKAAGSAPAAAPAAPPAASHDVLRDLPPEVAAHDAFVLRHGGLTGGWDEYDHGTFLRFRQQAGRGATRGAHLAGVTSALPSKSREEVEAHEHWFVELEVLRKRKNEAIQAWKAQQMADRQLAAKAVEEAERERARAAQDAEQRKQAQLKAQRKQAQEALEQWKEERAREDRALALAAEAEQREVLQRKHDLEAQRQAQDKAKLQVYLAKRQAEEAEAAEVAQRAQKTAAAKVVSEADLARFRERDLQALLDRRARDEAERRELAAKEERLEALRRQVQVTAAREPSRLTQPTQAHLRRVAAVQAEGGDGGPLVMRAPPRRAVPSWRAGL